MSWNWQMHSAVLKIIDTFTDGLVWDSSKILTVGILRCKNVLPHAKHGEDNSPWRTSPVIAYTPGWHFPAVRKSIQFSGKCSSRDGKGRPKPLLTASQLGKKLRATGDSTHGKISKCFFFLRRVYLWAWLPDLRPKQNDRVAACICSGSGKLACPAPRLVNDDLTARNLRGMCFVLVLTTH